MEWLWLRSKVVFFFRKLLGAVIKVRNPVYMSFLFYFKRNFAASLCSSHSGDSSSNTFQFFLIISFAFL